MPGPHARYGWRPQRPDQRDYELELPEVAKLPTDVDLRTSPHQSPIYNQLELGSCTANATAEAFDWAHHLHHGTFAFPSRLAIYYEERVMEGTVKEDSGAEIRDGIKVLAGWGAAPESDWPYDIEKFAHKPPAKAQRDAAKDLAITYSAPKATLTGLKTALAAGFPVVFGFTVYESFESARVATTGIVPMPGKNESVIGGHAVTLVGYDDSTDRFRARNSWGTEWGEDGFFEIPYLYVVSPLASDFWVIKATD